MHYQDELIADLFENQLGISKQMENHVFLTKVVPILVSCDASINITNLSEKKIISYEISIVRKDDFIRKMTVLLSRTEKISV